MGGTNRENLCWVRYWEWVLRKLKPGLGLGRVYQMRIGKSFALFSVLFNFRNMAIGSQAIGQAAIFRARSPQRLCAHTENCAVNME